MTSYDKELYAAMREASGKGEAGYIDAVCTVARKMGHERDELRQQLSAIQSPEGQGLRLGSIVRESLTVEQAIDMEGEDKQTGIVIGVVFGWCRYGESYEAQTITVRWSNGKIEDINREETDDGAEREFLIHDLDDVTPKQYLNIYIHDRAYGGGEEGGWWYDTMEPITEGYLACRLLTEGEQEADKAFKMMQSFCEQANENRRDISSVLSEGEYVACLESWPAVAYPSRKPHYC